MRAFFFRFAHHEFSLFARYHSTDGESCADIEFFSRFCSPRLSRTASWHSSFQAHAASIVSPNWESRIDAGLLDNLGKHRKYDFSSAIDCVRLIRNKKHHFYDLPADVQAQIGEPPGAFLRFFLAPERFPRLLLFLWPVLAAHLPSGDTSPLSVALAPLSAQTRARFKAALALRHQAWWPPAV
jgi:hypothetical protein